MQHTRTYIFLGLLLLLGALWSSCRKDMEYAPSAGNLEFSRDTVFLDTVFTGIGSSTRSLKVYNRTRDDVEIPTIRLAGGADSPYRLNVDGEAGKLFENIPLLAQDSLFIFIEATYALRANDPTEFLSTETIQFDTGDDQQEVQLVTLVKDAHFLYPRTTAAGGKETIVLDTGMDGNPITIEGFDLQEGQLTFTREKPYVIYGYAAVPQEKQLVIEAGARVFFHADSGILVRPGASIQINGTLSEDPELLENEVVFEGDRLESALADVPGQWGTLWIAPGSTGNTIDHLTVRNATVGILVEGDGQLTAPTLRLRNTQIHNSASSNLWGRSAYIEAENSVLGAAGISSFYGNLGGTYRFTHCTIANFWQNGFRAGAALELDNFSGSESADLIAADFVNCIVDGNTFLELDLRTNNTNAFAYSFTNCMIKFRDSGNQFANDPRYDFNDTDRYREILLNESANFFDASAGDFRIADPSPARDRASFEGAALVPFDLLGNDRTGSPDIGAYEVVVEDP